MSELVGHNFYNLPAVDNRRLSWGVSTLAALVSVQPVLFLFRVELHAGSLLLLLGKRRHFSHCFDKGILRILWWHTSSWQEIFLYTLGLRCIIDKRIDSYRQIFSSIYLYYWCATDARYLAVDWMQEGKQKKNTKGPSESRKKGEKLQKRRIEREVGK